MKNILYIILALLLVSACKKEKKIERNLWNNGGKWEIVKYEEIVSSNWPANEKNKVSENVGLIQFERNGKGWMIYSDDFEAYKVNINYTNTDKEITLTYEYQSTETFDLDWKKDTFTMTQSWSSSYNVYSPNPNGDSLTITNNYLYRYTCEKQ